MSDFFLDDTSPLAPGNAIGAILLQPDGRYLLQLRDHKAGIFFPNHWGCFGGGVDADDASPEAALKRELMEELGVAVDDAAITRFSHFTFDFGFCGREILYRTFYEVRLVQDQVENLKLGEGSALGAFSAREALGSLKLAPYDAFAIWIHANKTRLAPIGRN